MPETDWREILSFSQKELKEADKEKLCESLSWMEADDIELNFSDLKTLFRLSQDILKYKSEQVNNLHGQLETAQRKIGKGKSSSSYTTDLPTKSSDSIFETIAHQEEVIKANKEIVEQLYASIAELERRKANMEDQIDRDSESSRDTLSEMDAIAQLENEVTLKNRHIRKLMADTKVLEEENTNVKEKISDLKDKLLEATQLIENLTEQLYEFSNENLKLKDILCKSEETKVKLSTELEDLRKELFEKSNDRENIYEEIKSKVQHWKNIARSKKAEVEALTHENTMLKENLIQSAQPLISSEAKRNTMEESQIKELQEKLSEASNKIIESANLIEFLRSEIQQLRNTLNENIEFSISDVKNESDEGKEIIIINKLKKKNNCLTSALKEAEELIATRERELAKISAELRIVKSEEGLETIINELKCKKRQIRLKDESLENAVQEINSLNQTIDNLQLKNEAIRQKFNLPSEENLPTKGIVRKYRELEHNNAQMVKEIRRNENKLITIEMVKRDLNKKISKLVKLLNEMGCSDNKIEEIFQDSDDEIMPNDGGGESAAIITKKYQPDTDTLKLETQMQELSEENEGLRKGLQEILDYLKDNSTTSSGILALQCPSLERIINSMQARHAAGWFAPHMAAIMELKAAIGSKDALLIALHDARKETYEMMAQLSKESQKNTELEKKLHEVKLKTKTVKDEDLYTTADSGEFGTWITDKEQEIIDFCDKNQIENIISKGNLIYEDQLKMSLQYFHSKFKILFDKMTSIAVQAVDDKNTWSILEEQYKAQIENLKSQVLQLDDDETSDMSPGLIHVSNNSCLQRKCSYLEESYKYIRTLNENIKSEYLESKKEAMITMSEYEMQIQKLILSIASLTDKLRNSIQIDSFWKQNELLNNIIMKYRKNVDQEFKNENGLIDLMKRLEIDKIHIMSTFQKQLMELKPDEKEQKTMLKTMLSNIEQSVMSQQLQQICLELENKNKEVEKLEHKNLELQEKQSKIIDDNLSSITKEEEELMKDQLEKLVQENKVLKEQCQHIEGQLDIALLQLQDIQQNQMNNDLEVNMLRHQILDLQSTGDNKAIIARLSSEVLVAHLQVTESHKKIERLNMTVNKQKEQRIEAEEMLKARQKIFDVYSNRYESKFRYMYEIMQVLRQQYQGCIPLTSIEEYANNVQELSRKMHDVNEKLDEIEDLRFDLMAKHSVYNQILNVSKNNCLSDEENCPHKLQNFIMQGIHSREQDHYNNKIKTLKQAREELLKRCSYLERTLLQVNHGFEKKNLCDVLERKHSISNENIPKLELEDVQSDDEYSSKRDQTITLPQPQILKQQCTNIDMTTFRKECSIDMLGISVEKNKELANACVQTSSVQPSKFNQVVQTEENREIENLNQVNMQLKKELDKKHINLSEAIKLADLRSEELVNLNKEKVKLEAIIEAIRDSHKDKDILNESLQKTVQNLSSKISDLKRYKSKEVSRPRESTDDDTKSLISTLKNLELEKNKIVDEYKQLLRHEREEYTKSMKDMQVKIMDLQSKLDRECSDTAASKAEALKKAISKYTLKIAVLEDKCFKSQSELDGIKAELKSCQSELDRWKSLASERLSKMEQLNSQLEERHCHEVESYKAENEHWLSQLNETQREHMELRSRISEQKAVYVKQLADKDTQIEQLRSVIHGLRTQIMSMQTMISVSDPSFDLTAIVEVDEGSEGMSQPGSERLELKYDSTGDLLDSQEEMLKIPATSTTIWQEPLIERLRREKQLSSKQNAILRRQIKALAARERRTRLEAQNLKNQVFRISTSGSKVATAETASLHNKITCLQAQLMSARRDNNSAVALWDKWKRAQQTADRWQARYEEKCQEIKKIESHLHLAKSTVVRLEKEKRVLITRLSEIKKDKCLALEKQNSEPLEKAKTPSLYEEPPVSTQALLDRIQAQQRRIVALEVAEKGNEHLVSELEKALAQIASLKGQVLKLESSLLEAQIKLPLNTTQDPQPELEYWKSYCEMLKEENFHLTLRSNAVETTPSSHQHRVNDLEQTVLTLRGLVSKLQSEQKVGIVQKKSDSRPNSSQSFTSVAEKNRSQLESYRIEIANLKRSIQDKDLLLERSKEMLKIAAEREDDLLKENTDLRHQIEEFKRYRGGFLSA